MLQIFGLYHFILHIHQIFYQIKFRISTFCILMHAVYSLEHYLLERNSQNHLKVIIFMLAQLLIGIFPLERTKSSKSFEGYC